MRSRGSIAALKALSVIYMMSASAFGVAIALQSDQPWARGFQQAVGVAVPQVRGAVASVRERAIRPAVDWVVEADNRFFDWIDPHKPVVARAVPKKVAPVARATPRPIPAPQTLAPLPGQVVPQPPMQLADGPSLAPAPDANPPSAGDVSRVTQHLKVSLTKELYENFSLFLYVSKAERGPWAQRMYVFQKQASGDISMLYSFPVSTGAEILKAGPSGKMLMTDTPPGYYQLDPGRMYRRYHSGEWDSPMPYAMFFSWEHDGLQTGLAIHAASGDDIADLGKRASAGCVRLDPRNAQLLFNLVKKNYRGLAPRFAYDRRTATMARDGLLMHDKAGNVEYAEGYKVLVLIENNGGDNIVAALF